MIDFLELEKILLFASIALCAVSTVCHVFGWIFARPGLLGWGWRLIWLFLLLNTGTIAARWVHQGHGPYITLYEVLLSNVWVASVLYLFITTRRRELRVIGVFAVPILLLTLGAVALSPAEVSRLTPSYRSVWLIVHILFAKLTYGSILAATAFSLAIVLKSRLDPVRHPAAGRLPDPQRADELSYRLVAAALFFCSIMIASGAIWANQLWGKYWGWDPIEVWSLATWMIYGLYLHLRITFRFRGVRGALYVLTAFLVTIFSLFIMPYALPTVHNSFMFAK